MKIFKTLLELVCLVAIFYWVAITGLTIITLASGFIVAGVSLGFIDAVFKNVK